MFDMLVGFGLGVALVCLFDKRSQFKRQKHQQQGEFELCDGCRYKSIVNDIVSNVQIQQD